MQAAVTRDGGVPLLCGRPLKPLTVAIFLLLALHDQKVLLLDGFPGMELVGCQTVESQLWGHGETTGVTWVVPTQGKPASTPPTHTGCRPLTKMLDFHRGEFPDVSFDEEVEVGQQDEGRC